MSRTETTEDNVNFTRAGMNKRPLIDFRRTIVIRVAAESACEQHVFDEGIKTGHAD